jgi:hypothetical protein
MSTNQARPIDRKNPEYLRSVDPEVHEKVTERMNAVYTLVDRTQTAAEATPAPRQARESVPYVHETVVVDEAPATQDQVEQSQEFIMNQARMAAEEARSTEELYRGIA